MLGTPTSHKRWFSKFYDLRSRVAHGDVPLLRPGKYYDIGESAQIEQYIAEFWEPMDQAVAALLADPAARERLGDAGRALYADRFALEHTVEALRAGGRGAA